MSVILPVSFPHISPLIRGTGSSSMLIVSPDPVLRDTLSQCLETYKSIY